MKKILDAVRFIPLLLLAACAVATGPANLGDAKTQLIRYHDDGRYDHALAAVTEAATQAVAARAHVAVKPALVLDIDETALSNWPEMRADDFGYIADGPCDVLPIGPCGAKAWELSARDLVIAPTLALFKRARADGVAVFFITGRPEDERDATVRNLKDAGYDGWAGLAMKPLDLHSGTTDYKTSERVKIEAAGYDIIANVGDQPSDLAGGHAEKIFLLPNPFYRIP